MGRPKSTKPKDRTYHLRLDAGAERDARDDIERLSLITGTAWNMSAYVRMCMRAMKGKHLS